jgi:hypothetical protein
MKGLLSRACGALGAAAFVWLVGCKATIPEGVYSCETEDDCPSGFECRADDDAALYCFRRGGKPAAGSGAGSDAADGGAAGAPNADGGGASGTGGADAGPDGGMPPPVAPSTTGFSSLGGTRQGDGIRLYDERFEVLDRRCSEDGRYCATGGFEP